MVGVTGQARLADRGVDGAAEAEAPTDVKDTNKVVKLAKENKDKKLTFRMGDKETREEATTIWTCPTAWGSTPSWGASCCRGRLGGQRVRR